MKGHPLWARPARAQKKQKKKKNIEEKNNQAVCHRPLKKASASNLLANAADTPRDII